MNFVGYQVRGEESSSFGDFIVGDAKFPFLFKFICQFWGKKKRLVLRQRQKSYISNAPSAIEDQRGDANNTAFDAMFLQKSNYRQNLESPMASARGDLVWGVGGGVGYRQGRWNWRVDMDVGS